MLPARLRGLNKLTVFALRMSCYFVILYLFIIGMKK